MILSLRCAKLSLGVILILLLPAIGTNTAWGQYNAAANRIWAFGHHAGLDFSSGAPVAIRTAIDNTDPSGTLESAASVCDDNGALRCYTDGAQVWDRMGNLMPNGSDLTGLGQGVTNSTSQGALIVPMPDSSHKYYVFSLTAVDQPASVRGKLFCSIVDMTLNGGMGDVVAGRKGILIDSGLTEKMIGIVGDRCNMWILTCVRGQARYKAFELTAAGLNTSPVISNAASAKNLSFGYLAVSPDRKRIAASEQAIFGGNNGLELARFNAATGAIDDAVQLEPQLGYYGICFSPDSRKLYGSSFQSIYQFDVTAPDPAATRTEVSNNGRNTGLQCGPDGRIYFQHSATAGDKVSWIKFPNLSGPACDVVIDGLTLLQNTSMNFGFHNTTPVFSRDTLYTYAPAAAGCFATEYTLRAADTSGWEYEWNTGSNARSLTVTAPGLYWVRYHTPPCVFHTDTFRVSFPYGILPQLSIRNSCKGADTGKAWVYTYNGDTVTYHYIWRNAAGDIRSLTDTLFHAATGSYTLAIHTAHCDTLLHLYIPEEEHHVAFVSDTLICLGTGITFQNASEPYFTDFQWRFGDGNGSVLLSPTHVYAQPGSYTVTLAGTGALCRDTIARRVTVDAPVTDFRFAKDKDSLCTGQALLLSPGYDSTISRLHWQLGDGSALSTGAETIQHAYATAGKMPLSMTAEFRACPSITVADTVWVYALPMVDLGPDSSLCLQGRPLTLSNRAAGAGRGSYRWSTGATTAEITVRHEGRYSLTITNEHGCTSSESVSVSKDCFIDVPNAFTPNGDGSNDYFFPRQLLSRRLSKFSMQVLNRWGQVVFQTERIDGRGWDGRFNGQAQPEGVYIYRISAEIDAVHHEVYEGNVTLIR
ncbi:PKD domain-containing protein [Taibaiella helva]|uniref:PKD domain-containing protein n=1 Tax=Taibaiella helva TaxID=2301235 RepID=UPI000E57C62E|nr:PKD domain-containing protein [Taibaiella helva]